MDYQKSYLNQKYKKKPDKNCPETIRQISIENTENS